MKNDKKFLMQFLFFPFLLLCMSLTTSNVYGQEEWTAPSLADNFQNPVAGDANAANLGRSLFKQMCAICHGDRGKGDGLAGMNLNPRPSNLQSTAVQEQSDGAIYWKITKGRAPMAAYQETLTERQRWQLVNYIRQL
ncbi:MULTISPECIES: cytochrome c [Saprospirales]|jgi:mono/diheme cytochrome c family protein|uniref:c-type cytochrome n=1 Tax=Saprospirales TaxID=1936988 RepID=UPI0012EB1C44|nr:MULTISPECIES: cytochrome c [Saprospirales]MCI5091140.1 cytochrome c [Phaeodactylibacter sp.]